MSTNKLINCNKQNTTINSELINHPNVEEFFSNEKKINTRSNDSKHSKPIVDININNNIKKQK